MSDIRGDSLGFLETEGLVAAIEAADAMGKAASVELRAARAFGGGRVCIMVRGDLGSCQAAIEAGKAAAMNFGGFLQADVLARPDTDSEALWAAHMPEMERRKKERAARRKLGLSIKPETGAANKEPQASAKATPKKTAKPKTSKAKG